MINDDRRGNRVYRSYNQSWKFVVREDGKWYAKTGASGSSASWTSPGFDVMEGAWMYAQLENWGNL